MNQLGERAQKNLGLMVQMMADYSREISIKRVSDYVIVSCRLIEKRTNQPCMVYCLSSDSDLEEYDWGVWEGYKASIDFPFSLEELQRHSPRRMYYDCVITGKRKECFRFPCDYVDPGQIRCWIEEETIVE